MKHKLVSTTQQAYQLNKTLDDTKAFDKEAVKLFKDRAFGSLNKIEKLGVKFQNLRNSSVETLNKKFQESQVEPRSSSVEKSAL